MDNENKQATVIMWQTSFPTLPLEVVEIAFNIYRRKAKFPPTVAEMDEAVKGLYYTAWGDAAAAKNRGDRETYQRAMWLCDRVSEHKDNFGAYAINYSSISSEALQAAEAAHLLNEAGGAVNGEKV